MRVALLVPGLLAAGAAAAAAGCSHDKAREQRTGLNAEQAEPPLVLLRSGGRTIQVRVEVVRTPEDRARGLMFRRELATDAGMLFVFEREEQQSFWMKNTYLPLDMIFIDSKLRVVGIVHDAEPLTTTSRSVEQPSLYTLEVNAGFARRHGIAAGTPVTFRGI